MLPSTVTMSQWITRPIAKFAMTATASTTAIAIAAKTTALIQLRSCTDELLFAAVEFVVLASVLLRGVVVERIRAYL